MAMRDKLLCIGALFFFIVHSSVQQQECEFAMIHNKTQETFCYTFHLFRQSIMKPSFPGSKVTEFPSFAKSRCTTATVGAYEFELHVLSINSEEEELVVRDQIAERINFANTLDDVVIGVSEGRFNDRSDTKYILTKNDLNDPLGCLYMKKDGTYFISGVGCRVQPESIGNSLMWLVCKGRMNRILDLRSHKKQFCTWHDCHAALITAESKETFCYVFHLLDGKVLNDSLVYTDVQYGQRYCSKGLAQGGYNVVFKLSLLSINSEAEERFIRRHIDQKSTDLEKVSDEVLLGATPKGGWYDDSDTAYVGTKFDIGKVRIGHPLYLTADHDYYSRRATDALDMEDGQSMWIVCKGRLSGKRSVHGHLLRLPSSRKSTTLRIRRMKSFGGAAQKPTRVAIPFGTSRGESAAGVSFPLLSVIVLSSMIVQYLHVPILGLF